MKKLNSIDWIALVLVALGGINWGFVGAFEFDMAAAVLGHMSVLTRAFYVLVGVSAVYLLVVCPHLHKK